MRRPGRQPSEFGVSWGIRGFRIGRSQYGTWWISIGLPFGIRITRRLGREKQEAIPSLKEHVEQIPEVSSPELPLRHEPSALPSGHVAEENAKILERMRKKT
jgi:hypothetical protein